MKRLNFSALLVFAWVSLMTLQARGGIITFDAVVTGATSFGFDGDGDAINDVIFSTTDPFGFNTVGPGPNMSYINEPGLEGTTLLSPDLRVDFTYGASGNLSFGFAVNAFGFVPSALTFSVFDSSNNLLAQVISDANNTSTPFGTSSFPEAFVTTSFAGVATRAEFNFLSSPSSRYIIDNFQGTFGSSEVIGGVVPEPTSFAIWSIGLVGMAVTSRRRRTR
jgi:hypothetical protein